MPQPILSICVPSRNRQPYFQQTIEFLASSQRDDVQFIFADNSDDPSIMNDFMGNYRFDRRIRFLASENRVLAMIDNWERTVAAATGQWVSVIGDDDLIDPDLVDALLVAKRLKPDMEAFSWSALNYVWPEEGAPPVNVAVPLGTTFHDMPPTLLKRRAFGWVDATAKLSCGYSLYHSAISVDLLARIRDRFGGNIFSHPTVDYDSAFKIISMGRGFVFSIRPFSIFGTCAQSNTAAAYDLAKLQLAHATFAKEIGRDFDSDPWMKDFPFPSTLGLSAAIAQVQQFFRHQYGVSAQGWEKNFAQACAKNCDFFSQREDFEVVAGGYRQAFEHWQGGRWLADFNPVFLPKPNGGVFLGYLENQLHVSDRIQGEGSPASFYRAINDILVKPVDLKPELRSAGRENILLVSLVQSLVQSPAIPRSSASRALK